MFMEQVKGSAFDWSQERHDSSSSSMLSLSLTIRPRSLEERFWTRRCGSRLNSLDMLYELCNTMIWMSILPMLSGGDLLVGKASLFLAVAQLLAIHLTPQLWIRCRSMLLSSGMLLRGALLLMQSKPIPDGQLAAAADTLWEQSQQQQQGQLNTELAASMTMAAGFWGNLLFVLFHQQPVRIQVPLLAASSLLQALSVCKTGLGGSKAAISWLGGSDSSHSMSGSGNLGMLSSLVQPHRRGLESELLSVSQALNWGMGVLAAGGINPDCGLWQLIVPQREASMLAAQLFIHGFGGFLLPVFIAYIIEWRYKVVFLLNACNLPQQQQLRVLTPAAAIVRASLLLALLLYAGWLLLLATCTWLLCCAVASLLLA